MSDSAEGALLKLVEIQGRMLTDALSQLAKLSQPSTTPTQQLRELLEVAQMLQAPATPAAPAAIVGADASPWAILVDRALGALERLESRRALPSGIPAIGSAPSAALPTAGEARRIVLPRKLAAIVPHIQTICNWADSGTRPDMRATLVVEQLDAQQRAEVAELCQLEGFPSSIVSAVPDFAQRDGWVIPFLFALRAALLPPLSPSSAADDGLSSDAGPGTTEGNGAGGHGGR